MYLILDDSGVWGSSLPSQHYSSCPLDDEGEALFVGWYSLLIQDDAAIGGVLADWLEEQKPNLLATSPDPVIDGRRLDAFILRRRKQFWALAEVV